MKLKQDKIDELVALLSGSLRGKQKKSLLNELQNDAELAEYYELLKQIRQISPRNSKSILPATKMLSRSLYKDFLKEQASTEKHFGVQVFDSSLLPTPEGVRPAAVNTRVLKYKVGDALVELTVYPITIDSVEIIGQISGLEKNKKITVQAEAHRKKYKTDIDEFGLFRFERIEIGKCRLLFLSENEKESIIELTL